MSGYEDFAKAVILIGGVATALTAIWIFSRRALRAARQGWRQLKYLAARIEAMADLAEEQLKVNHGSSLLDKVNLIQPNHEAAELHWESLETRSAGIEQNLNAHRKEVSARLNTGDKRFDRIEELLTGIKDATP